MFAVVIKSGDGTGSLYFLQERQSDSTPPGKSVLYQKGMDDEKSERGMIGGLY